MINKRSLVLGVLVLLVMLAGGYSANAQVCAVLGQLEDIAIVDQNYGGEAIKDPAIRLISPDVTDDEQFNLSILDTFGRHLALKSQGAARNVLLVHLVGTFDCPDNSQLYAIEAAKAGYDVISVAYPNPVTVGAICGQFVEDSPCYYDYRFETVTGQNVSPFALVNQNNSINNRVAQLLGYLTRQFPNENWGRYSVANQNNFIYSGHSQGGGNAVLLGKLNSVRRIVTFASPLDAVQQLGLLNTAAYPAVWQGDPSATAGNRYFAFIHAKDNIVDGYRGIEPTPLNPYPLPPYQRTSVLNFFDQTMRLTVHGTTSASVSQREVLPGIAPEDNPIADSIVCSSLVNKTLIYSDFGPGEGSHSAVIRDVEVPKDANNVAIYRNVWRALLNACP